MADRRRSGEASRPAAAERTPEVPAEPCEPFAFDGFHGAVVSRFKPRQLEREIRRLVDPAAALETIHWGRNYLYRAALETASGRIDVVVKQFRDHGLRARLLRRWRGSKARRSFRAARAFRDAGLPTAEAVMVVESDRPDGPSYFVTRHLAGAVEARYLFRAANRGDEEEAFPEIDFEAFLAALGKTLRRMHDRGFFHRDLSIGNVLLAAGSSDLYIVDLNRARRRRRLRLSQRTRDLCRLAIFRPEDQQRFLAAYWGGPPGPLRSALYRLYHRGFLLRIEGKKKVRRWGLRLRDWLLPRRAHAHIPEASHGASARDKIVWDHLSDQPHQHARRLEKLAVRLADAPNHARQTAAFLAAAPRIWRRYRRLRQELHRPAREIPWGGVGICLRPCPQASEALLAALDDLAVNKALLRLHPWEEDHSAEEALAAELHRRGFELAFSLPQNRDLVRDPERWRHKIEELAERFTPYGRHFQVGQAINRSKWGIWKYQDYLALASTAAEILGRFPGVEILGPSVIDFEPHVTAAVVNLPRLGFRFDALASLLYVDRRGAPENTQLGFDAADKAILLQAVAETARGCAPRSWITEVNWPLREGPHSPAGRGVAVDVETQADYLARFYLLTLTTGAVERVYWWQLVARGYGLIEPREVDRRIELHRRPGFHALATLARELRGSRFLGSLASPPGTRLLHFLRGGDECVVGWSTRGWQRAVLPRPPRAIRERDGQAAAAGASEVVVSPSVRYFQLAP